MALSVNPLLKEMRGAINRQIVVKQYAHYTVITKFPDMRKVVLSPLQKKRNEVFADAVKYAQGILKDPEKFIEYKKSLQPGERVYNHAIKTYIALMKVVSSKPINTEDEIMSKPINTEDEIMSKPFNTKDEISSKPINTVFGIVKPGLLGISFPCQTILTRRRWSKKQYFTIYSKFY